MNPPTLKEFAAAVNKAFQGHARVEFIGSEIVIFTGLTMKKGGLFGDEFVIDFP